MKFMAGVCLITVLAGCEGFGFQENCPTAGEVAFSRILLDAKTEYPEKTQILMYDKEGTYISSVEFPGDNQTLKVPVGTYNGFALNNAAGVFFRGIEKKQTAEAYLVTTNEEGTLFMEQPGVFVLDNGVKFESRSGVTNSCVTKLSSALKSVRFTFNIRKYNIESGVRFFKGSLSGLATRMMLADGEVLRQDAAVQRFSASPVKESGMDNFEVTMYAFGFNEYIIGQKSIKKILNVELTFDDNTSKKASLDMTDYFNDAVANNECQADIILSFQNASIQINKWN